mmetsp:Transcript_42253/g.49143  ORF Transcript_42253/g.49143 Transcript_42253/m.49143 type:complete len:272 (-) Transcript_42253:33-848(-)|eukprot:CAMPEP_0168338856 /NCGR_PEP_ID=MMETSP0213-20121227/13110_1 /TAXON_ID=151035 /ORGANISM="Euplotes harpa, Strain FSP1.4" /LENGTH=271 /DNA_ID=CAMNT_0008344767 /DNA_START=3414 /DNA_END=4229 /DNA_ORIENTATION=+
MSKIYISPAKLLQKLADGHVDKLKILNIGFGDSAKKSFYEGSIPTSNMIELKEMTIMKPLVFTNPTKEHFNKTMKRLNIKEDDKVIVYNGISAAKAWFILRHYGFPSVRILDGGLKHWTDLKNPLNKFVSPVDHSDHAKDTFKAKDADDHELVHIDELLTKIDGSTQIIDVRRKEQFNSKEHNNRGHVPSSHNIFFGEFSDSHGKLRSKEEILEITDRLHLDPSKETIAYCQGGVTACIAIAALKEAGFKKLRLYDGSWSDFSSHEKTKHL